MTRFRAVPSGTDVTFPLRPEHSGCNKPQIFLELIIQTLAHNIFSIHCKMSITHQIPAILAPIHLLVYSTLLGTELYQSFVLTKVAFQALPRSAFTSLQKRIFPIYFRSQSALLALIVVTFPPYGPVSIIQKQGDWIPLAIAGMTAGLNLVVYGPRTRSIMIDRVHQGQSPAKQRGPWAIVSLIALQHPAMPSKYIAPYRGVKI